MSKRAARNQHVAMQMLAIFGERLLPGQPAIPSTDASRFIRAITHGARTFQPLGSEARARRTARLLEACAWTEAAIALVESDSESWHLSRLERDGAEWVCTLSRFPRLPAELDEIVQGRDPLPPLAILDALLEAQRRSISQSSSGDSLMTGHQVAVWSEDVFR
jgi:hypothetical protein